MFRFLPLLSETNQARPVMCHRHSVAPRFVVAGMTAIIRNRGTLPDVELVIDSSPGSVDDNLLLLRYLARGGNQGARDHSTWIRYVDHRFLAHTWGSDLICSGQRAFIGVSLIILSPYGN